VTVASAAPPVTPPPEPHQRRGFGDSSRGLEDLAPRLLVAAVLIPAAIAAALAGGPWLAAACGAAVAVLSFEWARMSDRDGLWPAFVLCVLGGVGAVSFASWGHVTGALICIAGAAGLSAARHKRVAARWEAGLGVVYIGLPVAAFLWLREEEVGGAALILGLFFIVWAADGAAYFAGRLIGGPKLHAAISPNKTWSGAIAGMAAGAAAGWGCAAIFTADIGAWLAAGALVGFVSILGDLCESLLKRRFGVKDASGFIPGHGGLLDRLDGLMAASVFAAGVVLAHPPVAVALSGAWG
jgi:phosphatidate cytidylyltransferase